MAQKNGLEAIGAMVCRHFGDDGYFVGIIISLSFSTDGSSLYRVKYSDGDMEDLDQEEYNYAYSLQLKRDGWTPLEEDDFGSDSNHSDNSRSTHAYKPAKVLHSFFVCFIALFITLFSLHFFHGRMLMIPTKMMICRMNERQPQLVKKVCVISSLVFLKMKI